MKMKMIRFAVLSVILNFIRLYAYDVTATPDTLEKTLLAGDSSSTQLRLECFSYVDINYSCYIDYIDFFLRPVKYLQDFNETLNWEPTGSILWNKKDSISNLDGTPFAIVQALADGAPITMYGYLTSQVFDLSMCPEVSIEFDQYKNLSSGQGILQISIDGTNWSDLYTVTTAIGSWSNPDNRVIEIPREYRSSTVKFRFQAAFPKSSGFWAIDNVKVKWNNWLNLNGAIEVAGIVYYESGYPLLVADIEVKLNAAEIGAGYYQSLLRFTTDHNDFDVPVNLTVVDELTVPEISINSTSEAINLTWDVVPGANYYNIYESDDPYAVDWGLPVVITDLTEYSFQTTVKKFYKITASTEPVKK